MMTANGGESSAEGHRATKDVRAYFVESEGGKGDGGE